MTGRTAWFWVPLLLLFVPSAPGDEPPPTGRWTKIKAATGGTVSMFEVKGHYGTVLVQEETGAREEREETARSLAEFLFRRGGVMDEILREWEVVERTSEENARKAREAAGSAKERRKAALLEFRFLEPATRKAIAKQAAAAKEKGLDLPALPSSAVKPVRIEVYSDLKLLHRLVSFEKRPTPSAMYGRYFPERSTQCVEYKRSPVIMEWWAARGCAEHLLSHYLRRVHDHNDYIHSAFRFYYGLRAIDPETWFGIYYEAENVEAFGLPEIDVYLTTKEGRDEFYPAQDIRMPTFLEFLRREVPVAFYRLLTAVNGGVRGVSTSVRARDVTRICEQTSGEGWSRLKARYDDWWKKAYRELKKRNGPAARKHYESIVLGFDE